MLHPHQLSLDRRFEIIIYLLNTKQCETATRRLEFIFSFVSEPYDKKRLEVKSTELRKRRFIQNRSCLPK